MLSSQRVSLSTAVRLSRWSLGAKFLLPSKISCCIARAQISRLQESNKLRAEQLEGASKQVELAVLHIKLSYDMLMPLVCYS